MSSEQPNPSRGFPVVGTILGVWIVLYLLMMWHGGWQWAGPNALAVGTPQDASLRLFGAVMPSQFRWQSPWLAPLLHDSLIGLIFLFFFWRSVAGVAVQVVGRAWTWVLFVGGGFAATATHLHVHPDSGLIHAIGPFSPILAAVGFQLGWGLTHPNARKLIWNAVKILIFLLIWMVLLTLVFGGSVSGLMTEAFREYAGVEAMGGALVGGVLIAFLIGAGRAVAAGPTAAAGTILAFGLLGGTAAAAATQAMPILASAERSAAADFLDQLVRTERAVDRLLDQRDATSAKREKLAREHARLLAHPFLEDYEGRETLEAYAKVLGLYTRPVEAPFITEPQLKKRFRAWFEGYEKKLRDDNALSSRAYDPWKGL